MLEYYVGKRNLKLTGNYRQRWKLKTPHAIMKGCILGEESLFHKGQSLLSFETGEEVPFKFQERGNFGFRYARLVSCSWLEKVIVPYFKTWCIRNMFSFFLVLFILSNSVLFRVYTKVLVVIVVYLKINNSSLSISWWLSDKSLK